METVAELRDQLRDQVQDECRSRKLDCQHCDSGIKLIVKGTRNGPHKVLFLGTRLIGFLGRSACDPLWMAQSALPLDTNQDLPAEPMGL